MSEPQERTPYTDFMESLLPVLHPVSDPWMEVDEAQRMTGIDHATLYIEPGDRVEVKTLTGDVIEYEVTKTIWPGHWGVDPYIPSNIILGEN